MKKLFVALAAVACATVSFAQVQWLDWFKIDKDNAETVAWTGDGEVAATETGFTVDTDSTTGLTYTPTAATSTESGRQFTFEFSVEAPVDRTKQAIPGDSKGGITIAKDGDTALAFYVVNYDTNAFEWKKFEDAGEAELGAEYTVTMTVDGASVTYEIGGKTLQCALPEATAPAAVTLLGAGSFTEIVGEQVAVASITKDEATTYFAAFDEAYAAAANGDTISLLENVGAVTLTPDAKTVTVVTNGKTFSVSADSVDNDKVLRCVYESGQIVTTLNFDKDANGAYLITSEGDLEKLQKAVAVGTAGADTFKQTADITLTKAWAGIGTYEKGVPSETNTYFCGVYDGDGYAINNLTFTTGGNQMGLFRKVYGDNAEIKDLTVNVNFITDVAESGAAAVVGVLSGGKITRVTANGTIEGTHACSGIAGMVNGNAVFADVTNNVNVIGYVNGSAKAGGMCNIVQANSIPGTPKFIRCVNNGAIKGHNPSYGVGGLVGYLDMAIEVEDCELYGSYAATEGSTDAGKVGSIFGLKKAGSVTMKGTNKVVANTVTGDAGFDGLNFATVDDNVATLVADSAAVKDANLKVMSPDAPDVVLAEVGDSIELDTSLATVKVTTTAENAEVQQNGNVYTVVSTAVAQIGDNKYETLAAAVNALTGGETITLITNYTLVTGEKVIFTKSATLNLADKTLTVLNAQVQKKGNENGCFAIDTGATVTITGGTLNLGDAETADGGIGGIQVHGAVITDCTMARISSNGAAPVFDIYGASVTVNAGADLSSNQDVFRFKDDGKTSTVVVNGGEISSGAGGAPMFYNYKTHTANVTINGGKFTKVLSGTPTNDGFFGNGDQSTYGTWNVSIDPAAKFNNDKIEQGHAVGEILDPGYGPVALMGADEGWYKIDKLTYAITVTVKDSVGGTASAAPASFQISDTDQVVTLTATPAQGYKFKQWNATVTIVDNQFTIAAGAVGDIAVEAEFEENAKPVVPGTAIDVPKDKTQEQFLLDVNANKAAYLKAPYGDTTSQAYLNCFTAEADGADKVKFALNADGQKALETIAENTIETFSADSTTLTVQEPIAGFYYSLKESTALETLDFGGQINKQATDATFTLSKEDDAGFWQVVITPVAVDKE